MNRLQERLINGLYGQAVADAVGDPFEFRTRIDPKSVSNFAKKADHFHITDDTQMAMFGFEAVHRSFAMTGGMTASAVESLKNSYIDWLRTQDEDFQKYTGTEGLLGFPVMHVQRAPGNTCLQACTNLMFGEEVKNDSKGCGSVMRLLPMLSYKPNGIISMNHIAVQSALLTHKHAENTNATIRYMTAAQDCLNGKRPQAHSAVDISDLGSGWTAAECVEMAIYAYVCARDFDELLEISIAHDGDSDSVGAIAGSLWGLAGREVPQEYIDKLVEIDAIKYVIHHYILTET